MQSKQWRDGSGRSGSRLTAVAIAAGALAGLAGVVNGCSINVNGPGQWSGYADQTETRELKAEHRLGRGLVVETFNGSVTITKVAGTQVRVTAKLRSSTAERLAQTTVSLVEQSDRPLVVKATRPEPRGMWGADGDSCSLTIEIPEIIDASVVTSNGSVTASDSTGTFTVQTSNASISLSQHAGPVTLNTSNGAITLHSISGPVDATTSNGSIKADALSSSVKAATSNGSLNISLDDASVGPAVLKTSNGTATLKVGAGFKGELEATTSNGSVQAEGVNAVSSGTNKSTFDFGPGGQPSNVKSSNGRVTIKR